MARTIHCTAVEVPAVSDPYLPARREFRDLVPWADPYIASLLHKLQRASLAEEGHYCNDRRRTQSTCELPPPLDKDDREDMWRTDWSPRNWPRG